MRRCGPGPPGMRAVFVGRMPDRALRHPIADAKSAAPRHRRNCRPAPRLRAIGGASCWSFAVRELHGGIRMGGSTFLTARSSRSGSLQAPSPRPPSRAVWPAGDQRQISPGDRAPHHDPGSVPRSALWLAGVLATQAGVCDERYALELAQDLAFGRSRRLTLRLDRQALE